MDTTDDRQTSVLRSLQLALFDEDFCLDQQDRTFVHVFLRNGGNATVAAKEANPALTEKSAKQTGHRMRKRLFPKPGDEKPADEELRRYFRWKQAHLLMREGVTEGEVVANARRTIKHGLGDWPIRKTLTDATYDDRGKKDGQYVRDAEVYEPNLAAANAANELLRKIGGFGKDTDDAITVPVVLTLNLNGKRVEHDG